MSTRAKRTISRIALVPPIFSFFWALGAGCKVSSSDCLSTLTCDAADAGDADAPVDADASCVPTADRPIPDSCGAFVSATGDDAMKGEPTTPVATFARAMAIAAMTGRIYACAESFAEAVVVTQKFIIYGGLDCKHGWTRSPGTTTELTAAPGRIPLTIASGADGSRVRDFAITAPDAAAPGGSSIAVVVGANDVELARCDLAAGQPVDGSLGESAPAEPAANGDDGGNGDMECTSDTVAGGVGPFNVTCAAGYSKGGDGGHGVDEMGDDGAAGEIDLAQGTGSGGDGDKNVSGWTCEANLGQGYGEDGANGEYGAAGEAGTSKGAISIAGFSGANGKDGEPGKPGQGGGGGGGRAGLIPCSGQMWSGGASGGGGGAGGCGGLGGRGGMAGGSSIALVSLGDKLVLIDVVLSARDGARGGDGGDSQVGGIGGIGGDGGPGGNGVMNHGCPGGPGGSGGNGGPGGGGSGGHSIGIAYLGDAPGIDPAAIVVGKQGLGGKGGDDNAANNDGAEGRTVKTLAFD